MAERNKTKLSPFEKELRETAEKVIEYKKTSEANIVGTLFKNPELIYEANITLDDFSRNIWKVYYQIIYDLIIVEKKVSLDEITIGMYLEKHPKLREQYEKNGGYNTITQITKYIEVKNFDSYITEIKKWNVVLKLCKHGFPVKDRLSDFVDMDAEEIYDEYSAFLNHTFANIDTSIKSYKLSDGIHELIETLDEGAAIGLPYYDMPMLTNETGGMYLGSITLLGGVSNAGKSTVARSTTIPSIIELGEGSGIVIMVNEDSLSKWQREMLVWICNNVLKFDIQKHTVRDGKYTKEVKEKLHEAAKWLEEQEEKCTITIIPFLQYKTSNAIKEIRKYAAMGIKYFILDTFKMDSGNISQNAWLQMQQAMVDIKDAVKSESLNVHILITFQLEKGSSVMRYYTQNNIGMAKNIVDVASTCIMIRDVLEDEYPDGNYPIKVVRKEGKNQKTNVVQKLEKDKNYQLFFIVKNQEGAANKFQIVAEHDKSRNIIREIGITNITPQF